MTDLLLKLVDLFETAARTERHLPGLKKPHAGAMYSILDIVHHRMEHGFYDKKPMKIQANSKMITCYDLAIDLMLLVNTLERQIIWSKANNFKYTQIGRLIGYDRKKVKNMYFDALVKIERKVKINTKLLAKLDKI